MYISITRQHMGTSFSQSVQDYVNYLEKENEDKTLDVQEHFFDQNNDRISPELVVKQIDGNTAKLKKQEPKFYALTISPSQRELQHIGNNPEKLRSYVREAMKAYAQGFHRDIPVSIDAIKYYAKIEYERTYKGFDKVVKENQPFRAQILKLEHDLVKIKKGQLQGNSAQIKKEIKGLKRAAPHQRNGELIKQGMIKEGLQTHVHIIVSRKDVTNRVSLSPGSSYKASETILNGTLVKRGFHRDQFYSEAEKTYDKLFQYERNFVERYANRKRYLDNPYQYFKQLMGLPTNQKSAALKILGKSGVPMLNVPTNKVQLALKTIKQLKRALEVSASAGSIGI